MSSEYTDRNLVRSGITVKDNKAFSVKKTDSNTASKVTLYDDVFSDIEVLVDKTTIKNSADDYDSESVERKIAVQNEITRGSNRSNIELGRFDEKIESVVSKKSSEPVIFDSGSTKQKVVLPVSAPAFIKGDLYQSSSSNQAIVPKQLSSQTSNVVKRNKDSVHDVTFENINGVATRSNASVSKGHKVELGIFQTHSEAIAGWFRIKKANPNLWSGTSYMIDSVENTRDRSTSVYRLYVETNDNASAQELCNKIKRHGGVCKISS